MKIRWAGKPPAMAPEGEVAEVAYTEGLWHVLTGKSWMFSDGNPAALQYAIRSGVSGLPTDDKVHYVHIGPFGHLVHESEIIEEEGQER